MTLEELIAAERRAVDSWAWDCTPAQRKRAYAKMRLLSAQAQRGDLPNDVTVSDAWLQLMLRAKDVLGISDEAGFYIEPAKRRNVA